jgi:hypothetical protein
MLYKDRRLTEPGAWISAINLQFSNHQKSLDLILKHAWLA